MNDLDALKDLDARLHAGFKRAGMAFEGMYTAPGANIALACSGYVSLGVQVTGDFGQTVSRRDEVEVLSGDGLDLRQGGQVFVEDVPDSGIGATYRLDRQVSDDGSLSRWVVRRV